MSLTATLEDRVHALERRLTDLAEPDTLAPNVLTFTGGTVGAKFTGLVNALGLVLPAGVGSPAPNNEIVWERISDGAVVATLSAVSGGGATGLTLGASAPPGGTVVQAILEAGNAELFVQDTGNGNPIVGSQINGGSATFMTGAGNSQFWQCSVGLHEIQIGTGFFAGGGATQQAFGVNHSLPANPVAGFVIPTEFATWYAIDFAGGNPAGFTAVATAGNFGVGHNYVFAWLLAC